MRRANHGDPADDVAAAIEQLGERHALVRLLRASRVVAEGMLSVAGVAAGGVLEIGLPLVVAAVIVELGLCARWLSIRSSLRSVCLELISRGEERLDLTPLLRAQGRLDSARHRARLARSIVEAVRILDHRPARVPAARPLFSLRVVRPVAPELRGGLRAAAARRRGPARSGRRGAAADFGGVAALRRGGRAAARRAAPRPLPAPGADLSEPVARGRARRPRTPAAQPSATRPTVPRRRRRAGRGRRPGTS